MISLYTLHETAQAGEFIIQKFDTDYHCESVYACSLTSCMCPQGHKDRCRHRTMLPLFLKFGHIGDGWFLEWDTRLWRRPVNDIPVDAPTKRDIEESQFLKSLPAGMTMIGLDNPDVLHSTIAQALNEPAEMVKRPAVGAPSPPSPPEGQQPAPSAEAAPVSPVVAGVPIVKRRKMS